MTPTPAPPDAMPWTASGRALLQALKFRWRTHILAIEAEAAAGTEDAPMHTDEEYIEYGVVQYRRGRAQAEAEAEATAAVPLDASNVREAIVAALEATLGPPADGISTAYRRAIVDYAIARLSADEEGET